MASRRNTGSSKKTRKTTRKTSARKTSTRKTGARKASARKTSGRKKSSRKTGARKTGARKTGSRKTGSRRYGSKASKKVGRSMHEMKEGSLRSGRSGKRVTNPKQAIAIGLSEARREGGKVPSRPRKKRASKRGGGRGRSAS